MEKKITIHNIDPQYAGVGCVFKTDNDKLCVIERETLNALLEKKNALHQKLSGAMYLGNNVDTGSDKVTKARVLLNNDRRDTGSVVVNKNELSSLINSSKRSGVSSNIVLTMQKKIDAMAELQKKSNTENKNLRTRIDELQTKYAKSEKDKEICQNVQGYGQSNSFSDARLKVNQKKKRVRDANAALIIDMAVAEYNVYEIQRTLEEQYNISVSLSTIYRALSVKKDEDKQRLMTLFDSYISEKGNCTREILVDWFEKTRIKKLKLLCQEDYIKKYGADNLPDRDWIILSDAYYQRK